MSTFERLRSCVPGPILDATRPFVRAAIRAYDEAGRKRRRKESALAYYNDKLRLVQEWAPLHTETSNFYYDLDDLNKRYLASLLSVVTGAAAEKIQEYFNELETNQDLKRHLTLGTRSLNGESDIQFNYGRRLGWYALARHMKPLVIIETGVAHGVGSCVLTEALKRNTAERFPGRYFGTEINPAAGQLFTPPYSTYGEIILGDSIKTLEKFDRPVDLFINDSDHSADYEYQEYRTIRAKLSPGAVVLGDNSHVTDKLLCFSREVDRNFLFFAEKPMQHWYPGAGIGISFHSRGQEATIPGLVARV